MATGLGLPVHGDRIPSSGEGPEGPSLWTTIARAAVVGLTYFAAAELGHATSFRDLHQAFATFWPASGVLLAALVLNQYRLWPALLSAALAASVLSDSLVHDTPLAASAGFAVARALEAVIGALLV